MTSPKLYFLFPVLLLSFFFYSCGTTTDTVEVARESPGTPERPADDAEAEDDDFRQISIGLIEPVTNFDPLFAQNLSTKQALSLVYDGLFTVDEQGNPEPAIATDYSVSDKGLEYTITINRDLFYHDNAVFTAGVGRRIHARDIKWAFERTAKIDVPRHASELLMNVRGFENYYLEQHTVFDPDKRVLDGAYGIEVKNASTIQFTLYEQDPHFLKKLASSYLYIYPRESVEQARDGIPDVPVGTGAYEFNQSVEDNRYILTRFEPNNNSRELPSINRIDLHHSVSETDLFQKFISEEIDYIPETGPGINNQIATDSLELQETYQNNFNFLVNDAQRITAFYMNRNRVIDRTWLLSTLKSVSADDFSQLKNVTIRTDDFEESDTASPLEEYFVSFTDNPYANSILSVLNSTYFQPDSELVFFDVRIPTRRTSIYTQSTDNIHYSWNPLSQNYWLRTDNDIVSIYHNHIEGITASTIPWKIFIHNIRVHEKENSAE